MSESYWPAGDEPIRDTTIASILRDAASRAPDHVALVAGTADPATRTRRTYAEALAEAEAVAHALAALFRPGERLAVIAPSSTPSCLLTFAVAMARLVLVPISPLSRTREIEHILSRSGAAGVVFAPAHRDNDLAGPLAALGPRLPGLREQIPFGNWPDLVRAGTGDDTPLPPPAPADVAQVVFTSGTTGAPKGVMLTHRAMTNAARFSGERFGIAEGDVYVGTILGVKTTIIFGQSETSGHISLTFPDDDPGDKAATVGRALPHLEARVVDPKSGTVVAHGEIGELQVRGPGVMAGYLDEPEQTGRRQRLPERDRGGARRTPGGRTGRGSRRA